MRLTLLILRVVYITRGMVSEWIMLYYMYCVCSTKIERPLSRLVDCYK